MPVTRHTWKRSEGEKKDAMRMKSMNGSRRTFLSLG